MGKSYLAIILAVFGLSSHAYAQYLSPTQDQVDAGAYLATDKILSVGVINDEGLNAVVRGSDVCYEHYTSTGQYNTDVYGNITYDGRK